MICSVSIVSHKCATNCFLDAVYVVIHLRITAITASDRSHYTANEDLNALVCLSVFRYMEPYEVPSGGDWAVHRGAAVVIEGAEDIQLSNCTFDQPGGNGLLLSDYTRNCTCLPPSSRTAQHAPLSLQYLSWMPLAYAWGTQVEYQSRRNFKLRDDLV